VASGSGLEKGGSSRLEAPATMWQAGSGQSTVLLARALERLRKKLLFDAS